MGAVAIIWARPHPPTLAACTSAWQGCTRARCEGGAEGVRTGMCVRVCCTHNLYTRGSMMEQAMRSSSENDAEQERCRTRRRTWSSEVRRRRRQASLHGLFAQRVCFDECARARLRASACQCACACMCVNPFYLDVVAAAISPPLLVPYNSRPLVGMQMKLTGECDRLRSRAIVPLFCFPMRELMI